MAENDFIVTGLAPWNVIPGHESLGQVFGLCLVGKLHDPIGGA
jgi:hypothetical protein